MSEHKTVPSVQYVTCKGMNCSILPERDSQNEIRVCPIAKTVVEMRSKNDKRLSYFSAGPPHILDESFLKAKLEKMTGTESITEEEIIPVIETTPQFHLKGGTKRVRELVEKKDPSRGKGTMVIRKANVRADQT